MGSAHELDDKNVIYAFSKDLKPVLKVNSGDTVRIRTMDCFGNQVQSPDDELNDIDWDRINPATGPIYVEGAKPGGSLKVKIEKIELDNQSASCTGEGEGVCGDRFTGWSTSINRVEGNHLIWNDKLSIPLKPMIGVIGVAPSGDPINCGTPGSHGGNMDCTEIGEGTTLYFPVEADGALFGCGDMHAVMGDGEISVSGAEIAGWATVNLTALPELSLPNPIIETATHVGVISSEENLDKAASVAVHQMVDLVHKNTGADEAELVMLFSLVGDVRVCQMVDPEETVRFMVPKYVLDSYGFSLI